MAFGFMNAAWALGAVIGPAVGGAIASSTGDWIPFLLAGAACAVALVAVLRFGRLAAAGTSSRPLQSTGPDCA
jgi:MFS family permease